jgi:radial spoke head protein 9
LLWPGYFFVHKANTKIFAGVYIGNGIKNFDLPFMI